jgi:hypothetical protein
MFRIWSDVYPIFRLRLSTSVISVEQFACDLGRLASMHSMTSVSCTGSRTSGVFTARFSVTAQVTRKIYS